MKNLLRTTSAAALLAALVPAQNDDESAKALARVVVVETHEGDLAAAEASYRALLADPARSAAHGEAALRLGSLLWRLDRCSDARPFLQRAADAGGAIGTEAQRILQGQGDSDKAAQERLTRARALVSRLFLLLRSLQPSQVLPTQAERDSVDNSIKAARQELAFLGDAGATALVEHLRGLHDAAGRDGTAVERDGAVLIMAEQLWRIGTEPARTYFAEVAADPLVEWRRAIVSRCSTASDDMVLAAVPFLRDGDPTGEVARMAAAVAYRLPLEVLGALGRDPSPIVRAAAWLGLATKWYEIPPADQDALVARIGESLVAAFATTDPRSRDAAERLLEVFLATGPASARRLAIQQFVHLPADLDISPGTAATFVIGDDELRLLAAAGRTLGPCPPLYPNGSSRRQSLAELLHRHQPTWTTAAVDSLLDLIDLGYARLPTPDDRSWIQRFGDVASTDQATRAIGLAVRMLNPEKLLWRLTSRPGHPQFFAAARESFEAAFGGTAAGWRILGEQKLGKDEASRVTTEAGALIQLAAKSGAPEAPAWLSSLIAREPAFASNVAYALVAMSIADDREPVRVEMRKLLVDERVKITMSRKLRSMLFAELVRLGDVPAIGSFARALELGTERDANHPSPQLRNASILEMLGTKSNAGHHYDAEHLAAAWSAVLGADSAEVTAEIANREVSIPATAIPAALRSIPRIARAAGSGQRFAVLKNLTLPLAQVTAKDVATGSELRTALAATLGGDDDDAAMFALSALQSGVVAEVAPELRARLSRTRQPGRIVAALQSAGQAVGDEEWATALRSADWRLALEAIPANAPTGVRREVEAMLRSSESSRRAAACSALARWLSADSVAPLLEALRDRDETVRAAATDALQRVRFHEEQQAFWAKDRGAIDTSPAATAAKLLAQAMPGQAKEQRLLAIRSLASLGASEALPHLIDWSKDGDADVAGAARHALEAIHARAGERK